MVRHWSEEPPLLRHWSEHNGGGEARGWDGAPPGALVPTVSPKACRLGLAGAPLTKTGGEHRDRGIVGKDRLPRQHMPPPSRRLHAIAFRAMDGVCERLQQSGGFAHPIRQRRAVDVEPVALEDLALAVKRQVIGILIDQHMGEKTRSRPAPFDRAAWQRGLGEAIAARTGHPGPHDAVHDKAAGDVFQFFGHILAQPAQLAAALGTLCAARY